MQQNFLKLMVSSLLWNTLNSVKDSILIQYREAHTKSKH